MILPPPTTTATSTSISRTDLTSRAMAAMVSGSMPNFCWPANASPESFSRTRRQRGFSVNGLMSP